MDEVLLELIESIPLIPGEDEWQRRRLHETLLNRERLSSTALGRGIALPHACDALATMAGRPLLVFGRHATGVNYGAADDLPIRLFFLVLAPDVGCHLRILSRLTRLLRRQGLQESLLLAYSSSEVIDAVREAEVGV